MSKLKLLVGVCICGALFSGCAIGDIFGNIFGVGTIQRAESVKDIKDCIPTDLKERISSRSHYSYSGADDDAYNKQFSQYYTHYKAVFMEDASGKCNDLAIASYNEAVKNAKKLPSNIKAEEVFEYEWNVCIKKMPEWLETKLDGYIAQNKGNDKVYTEALKLKTDWNEWIGKATKIFSKQCKAVRTAINAIENDSIDLGSGKKAKCANLDYKDASKCLAHYKTTYFKSLQSQLKGTSGCTPTDLKARLMTYGYSDYYEASFQASNSKNSGCNKWLISEYNEAVKNAKTLPTTFEEEKAFEKEWLICDAMPKWLEENLDKYIRQNRDNDVEYVSASKFKEKWQDKLSGKAMLVTNKNVYQFTVFGPGLLDNSNEAVVAHCLAKKKARAAIENDYINLGSGKKAKCKDLSWSDSYQCMNHFNDVYDKIYKETKEELDIKREREKYEKQNKK